MIKRIYWFCLNSLFFLLGCDGWGNYNEVDNFWAIQKLTMGVWSVVIFILVCCSLSRQKFWTNARLITSADASSARIPLSNRISLISTNIDPFYDKFCMNINHCVSFCLLHIDISPPIDYQRWLKLKTNENRVWHPAITATKMQFTKVNIYDTKKQIPILLEIKMEIEYILKSILW